jgi:predicted transcriptional regulator
MLESLITSKTRVKLLVKFFINAQTKAYLRNLESEFGESTNGIRLELNRFEKAGLLDTEFSGNKKFYKANTTHPFFNDIHHLLLKHTGIETVVDEVAKKVGHLKKAFITGDFARGIQGNIIDLTLVGENFDHNYLNQLIRKAEELVSFKIRYITISPDEMANYLNETGPFLLIWSAP